MGRESLDACEAVRAPYEGLRGHEEVIVSDHVYKKVELVGSSTEGIEGAVNNAIARAEQTLDNLRWFEVVETRGDIKDGQVHHWQVTIKVGFTLSE